MNKFTKAKIKKVLSKHSKFTKGFNLKKIISVHTITLNGKKLKIRSSEWTR